MTTQPTLPALTAAEPIDPAPVALICRQDAPHDAGGTPPPANLQKETGE
jgi:hypothetical protein